MSSTPSAPYLFLPLVTSLSFLSSLVGDERSLRVPQSAQSNAAIGGGSVAAERVRVRQRLGHLRMALRLGDGPRLTRHHADRCEALLNT